MTPQLEVQLSRELYERAQLVEPDPGLAAAVVRRARSMHRRRRATAVIVAGAMVTAVLALAGTTELQHSPAPADRRAAGGPTLSDILYTTDTGSTSTPMVLHVHGKAVQLPGGWDYSALPVAHGVLLDASTDDGKGPEVGAYLPDHGTLTILPSIYPPFAVNGDGTLVAGTTSPGLEAGGPSGLVLMAFPSLKIVKTLPNTSVGSSGVWPSMFLSDGRVLLGLVSDPHAHAIWNPTTDRIENDTYSSPDEIVSPTYDGQVFVATQLGSRAAAKESLNGQKAWQVTIPGGDDFVPAPVAIRERYRDQVRPELSPDEEHVAAVVTGPKRIAVIDTQGPNAGTAQSLDLGPLTDTDLVQSLTWYDSEYLLVVTITGTKQHLLSCSIIRLTCATLLTSDSGIAVAAQQPPTTSQS